MRLLGIVLFTIILLGTLTVAYAPRATAQSPPQEPKVPVGVHYYAWFGYDARTNTWPGGNGTSSHWSNMPSTAMNIRPASYYSSLDNQTVGWQLGQMHDAGITFLIASWWGPNDYTDDSILNLFKYVNATDDAIQLAIMVEPYDGLVVSQAENYVYGRFYEPYREHIFNWLGKPLLCFFLPTVPEDDPDFTIRTVGNGIADWQYVAGLPEYVDGTNKPPEDLALYTNGNHTATDGEVTVTPRFDNYYEYQQGGRNDYLRLDVNYTGMFRELWAYAQANATLIIINSWNEYTESSNLEEYVSQTGEHVCPVGFLLNGTSCLNGCEFPTSIIAVPLVIALAVVLLRRRKVPNTLKPST